MSCVARKPVFEVSDQVQQKLVCTITEEGLSRLEISDLGIYLFVLVEALPPSQQFSVMSGCFPGLNQY